MIYMYKLRKIRDEQGLTQEKLAQMAEVGQRTISDIERSNHDTTIEVLKRLAKALKVTPNDIIGWEDNINDERRIKRNDDSERC